MGSGRTQPHTQDAFEPRTRELAQLQALVEQAAGGVGGLLFLDGVTGAGKSALLDASRRAVIDRGVQIEPVTALCYETGREHALGPFGEILRALTREDRRRTRARQVLTVVQEIAPPLVELIPVLGKVAALTLKAASTGGIYALGSTPQGTQSAIAYEIAESLASIAARESPLGVLIDDAHWMDAASCEVVRRLVTGLSTTPAALVLAYDGTRVSPTDPIAKLRAETITRPLVSGVSLKPLGPAEVSSLVRERYGHELHPALSSWLAEVCDGNPLFVSHYLDALEECNAIEVVDGQPQLQGDIAGHAGNWHLTGGLQGVRTPSDLMEVFRPRLAELDPSDRLLLEMGSVQGRRFLTSLLVPLLDRTEQDVLDQLHQIEESRRLIAFESAEDWWSDRSALCSFESGVVRDLLYERFARSPYEQRQQHRAVAAGLERLIESDSLYPRHAMLEIAHQYELARDFGLAAWWLRGTAESALAEGGWREAASIADRALRLSRHEQAKGVEALELASTIALFLVASEPYFHADQPGESQRLLDLADEAHALADGTGNARVQAQARFAQGIVLCASGNLSSAIETWKDGRRLAVEAGDADAEFAMLIRIGHHSAAADLEAARGILREAEGALVAQPFRCRLDERSLRTAEATLGQAIGVAEFDLGNYGDALDALLASTETLKANHQFMAAGWGLSYLGQLETAVGAFSAAERHLSEGLELFSSETGPVVIRGYLRSLMGRLHLCVDPPRMNDARRELEFSRIELGRAGHRGIALLGEVHYAEYLTAVADEPALTAAENALHSTIREADELGWPPPMVSSWMLLGRMAALRGNSEDAATLTGTAATQLLEAHGALPTVRTEEVFFEHAVALERIDDPQSSRWLRLAREAVLSKRRSLADHPFAATFLEAVPLTQNILDRPG